jgi:hypothetical protein
MAEKDAAPLLVRCQDRDELARLFTRENAARNGLDSATLSAHTEALLSGEPGKTWDLILSNIPAKAGEPVLEDFIGRSAGLLAPGGTSREAPHGRAIIVVVNPLADFFRTQINGRAGRIIREETGPEHTVFVYGPAGLPVAAQNQQDFVETHRFYLRNSGDYETEGVGYHIDALYGAAEFDRPGGAMEAATKLLCRLGPEKLFPSGETAALPPILIHEGGQGHFLVWLLGYLEQKGLAEPERLVLHGRNILGLEAAKHNLANRIKVRLAPGVELGLDETRLREAAGTGSRTYGFIAAFPLTVPQTSRYDGIWEGLGGLLLPGACAILAFPSTEADRFDKRKPSGFTRLGDLKRQGFRALAYRAAADWAALRN